MKKKLSFLMVALVAVAAFAVQVSRRAVAELTVVSEATVWDFAKVTLGESYTGDFKLEGDAKNTENIYANFEDITFDPTFKADALAFTGEYPVRSNSKKFAQSGTLHFKTSVAGKIVVKFSDTGSSASATAVKRYLVVNDIQTEYWTSRENNGESPYAAQLNVETGEIDVPAGDVTIKGSSAIVVTYVAFTPNAAEGGETGGEETWEVATSISVDDVVLFTYADGDVKKELKDIEMFGTNSVGATEDYTGDKPAGIYPLTVVAGSAEGSVAFKDANGKFLEWSSGNTMTLADAVTENSSWNVSFTEGVATVANVKDDTRKLQYNSSNPRFCSYTSAQKAPILWKKVVAAPVSPYPAEAIWGGEFGAEWGDATTVPAADLQDIKAGDEFVVHFIKIADVAGQWDAQLFIQSNGFNIVNAGVGGQAASAEAPYEISAKVSGLMKEQILANGLTINGVNCEAYITINKAQTAAADNSLWIGQTETKGEWGGVQMPSAPVVAGQFVKILAQEPVAEASARNRALPAENTVLIKKVEGWNSFDPEVVATASAAGDGYEFEVTDAILAELQTNGFVIQSAKPLVITGVEMNKWATPVPAQDVTIAPAEGDIAAALATATEGVARVGKITINLTAGAAYTLSAPIVTAESVIINGNGATIDASNCKVEEAAAPFIQMATLPTFNLNAKGAYEVDEVSFNNVKITGLKAQLFYANKQMYLIKKLAVDNSVIAIAGATEKTIFDFNSGGNVVELSVANSTIWADAATTWKNGGFYSSQSGQDAVSLGAENQKTSIVNSTIYNIAKGATTSTRRSNSKSWMVYEVKNNVIVNSGKSGQFLIGLNAGQAGNAANWDVKNNSFNFEVEGALTDVSTTAESGEAAKCKNAAEPQMVEGVVAFANAAEGDFTLAAACAQNKAKIGDPRWLVAAPIEKLYLIGDINNWKLNEMVEMTFNEETQAFEYEYAPTGQVNFSVADQMFADGDWDGFKAGHRFAIGDGNIVPTLGEEVQLVSVFEGNIQLQAGNYKISVTKDLKMTITAKTDGISEVKANQNNAVIYNLNGVRVDKAQKGLYIVNGKKVVIK